MKTHLIQAVLFDFDGTLTRPGAIDFPSIKASLGCPRGTPVLEFIDGIQDPECRRAAEVTLDMAEMAAAETSSPQEGAAEVIRFLKAKRLAAGILTRNTRKAVLAALARFSSIRAGDFDVIITRDDPVRPKPSADGIRLAAERLSIPSGNILVVGDFIFDIDAGNEAGALTVFLDTGAHGVPVHGWDHRIGTLPELVDIIRRYIPLPAGKFPNDLLQGVLDAVVDDDPSVIIAPGIGEDAAAVDVTSEETLILKSDPITFATDAIGRYAVLVNANDLATTGAAPRWMLTTLLFPVGATPEGIYRVIRDLADACRSWGITLCGGHTEITDAVTRPVISGMLAGTVSRSRLIDKKRMKPGDRVLLTKGVAVEGTSIIARELAPRLSALGLSDKIIDDCRALLDQVGVIPEARIAAGIPGTTAMHDVTEGGLATALYELSAAGGCRIRVHMANIPVLPQTEILCRLLNLHPLGLIGSGSLLICCREADCRSMIRGIHSAGVQVTVIGEVLEPGTGVEALFEGSRVDWPRFEVDEIARLFATISQTDQ